MTEQERCPHCDGTTLVNGEVLGDQYTVVFSPRYARTFRSVAGVALASRAVACLSCGRVWTKLDPARLRDFIQTSTGEIGRQHLDEMERGPYRDLPPTTLARAIGEHIAELDALVRDGHTGKAVRRYREMRGVIWDQAVKDVGRWAELTRPEKLALFGWQPKKKESFDDLL